MPLDASEESPSPNGQLEPLGNSVGRSTPASVPNDPDYPHLEATKFWEQIRSAFTGIARICFQGVGIIVANRVYEMGETEKSLISMALAIGFISTPLVTNIVAYLHLSVTKACSGIFAIAALSFLIAGIFPTDQTFIWGWLIGFGIYSTVPPLLTALWRQNAPDHVRGKLFSWIAIIGMISGFAMAMFVRWFLREDATRYSYLFLIIFAALVVASIATFKIPSQPIEKLSRNPFARLKLLFTDRVFGYLSLAWMLMGFANLGTLPLRTDFISNPKYGLNYSNADAFLLVMLLPAATRILSVSVWGRLFDKINFIVLRVLLNCVFMTSIFLFFFPNFWLQVAGSILFGIGAGGGEIAWNLWVTKFSTPEKTGEYMSVHTFLTGCRGIVSPFLAFQLTLYWDLQPFTWVCCGIAMISCLMLLPVFKYGIRN